MVQMDCDRMRPNGFSHEKQVWETPGRVATRSGLIACPDFLPLVFRSHAQLSPFWVSHIEDIPRFLGRLPHKWLIQSEIVLYGR